MDMDTEATEALLCEMDMQVDSDEAFERADALLERWLPVIPQDPAHPLRLPSVGLLLRMLDHATGETAAGQKTPLPDPED